jgi:hypothetical protein
VLRALFVAMLLLAAGGLAVRYGLGQPFGIKPLASATPVDAPATGTRPPARPTPSAGSAGSAEASGATSVEVSEALLSERINSRVAGASLGQTPFGAASIKRLGVRVKPDRVEASGDADVAGQEVPVSLGATIDVQAGAPIVTLRDASAAGLPLPESTRASLERSLQSSLDDLVTRQRLRLSSVTLGEGKLTVVGTRY